MRIAFFSDSFFPFISGVAAYVENTSRELMRRGHQVMIVAPKWEKTTVEEVKKIVPGAEIALVPGIRPFFYNELKIGSLTPKSISEVRKFAPDLIHFHTPGMMGLEATLLSKLLKIPLITTFHTYYMEPEGFVVIGLKEDSPAAKMLQDSLWKVSERIHKPCDVVIAPTDYVGKDLKKRWKGINIKVIYGAIDTHDFRVRTGRKKLRERYGIKNEVVFMSVGRLSAEKHYEVLITAFSMMLLKHPRSKLVFIGGGPAREELEHITKMLGVDRAVMFLGQVEYDKLRRENYYAMGDVFVTPSTWDTQGLSIVEAMAARLPVVAFDYRAMPEVVGEGGRLVKHMDQYGFAKTMAELAENASLRKKLGKRATKQSTKYEIAEHTSKLCELYEIEIKKKKLK